MTIHIVQPAVPHYRVAFFSQLQREFSKRNERLHVYASPRDHMNNIPSVPPVGFDARTDFPMSVHLRGRVCWQTDLNVPLVKGDVLVLNGNPRMLSNYPLWLRAKRLGVPVVWWGHGWTAHSHGRRSKLRQCIMRFADAIILYTEQERSDYVALGFSADRTSALNNGVDIKRIDSVIAEWDGARIHAFRKANGLDARAHWCIFVGRVSDKSGINLLIEALPAVRDDIGLIILGDGAFAEDAKARSRALDAHSRVIWVGAEFSENAIAPWMLSASAFVYPGTVGLSLIHGFAYGLPAVVHADRDRQMPEFAAFENHRNGLSFERGSARSLADAVNDLFSDGERQAAMSKCALSLVHRTFNIQDMSIRFMKAIDQLSCREAVG